MAIRSAIDSNSLPANAEATALTINSLTVYESTSRHPIVLVSRENTASTATPLSTIDSLLTREENTAKKKAVNIEATNRLSIAVVYYVPGWSMYTAIVEPKVMYSFNAPAASRFCTAYLFL